MNKWLCIGCGEVVEDDSVKSGCKVCRGRAMNSYFQKFAGELKQTMSVNLYEEFAKCVDSGDHRKVFDLLGEIKDEE
jgi:rubrerythrin